MDEEFWDRDNLIKEIARLRLAGDVLARWAQHADSCKKNIGHFVKSCTCGYEDAMKIWKDARND